MPAAGARTLPALRLGARRGDRQLAALLLPLAPPPAAARRAGPGSPGPPPAPCALAFSSSCSSCMTCTHAGGEGVHRSDLRVAAASGRSGTLRCSRTTDVHFFSSSCEPGRSGLPKRSSLWHTGRTLSARDRLVAQARCADERIRDGREGVALRPQVSRHGSVPAGEPEETMTARYGEQVGHSTHRSCRWRSVRAMVRMSCLEH